MKAQAALVWPDGTVHLDAVALVQLELTLVVDPRHAEQDHALRLGHALEDLGFAVLRILVEHDLERLGDLHDSLMELRLAGVLGLQFGHEFVDESAHELPSTRRSQVGVRPRRTRACTGGQACAADRRLHPATCSVVRPGGRSIRRRPVDSHVPSGTNLACPAGPFGTDWTRRGTPAGAEGEGFGNGNRLHPAVSARTVRVTGITGRGGPREASAATALARSPPRLTLEPLAMMSTRRGVG